MIKHTPSTVAIFQTDNYKLFDMVLGNRPINTRKVQRIIAEIESGNDWLQYCPILVQVVKDKMKILDGQHRYFISKKMKRPVYYIIVSEDRAIVDIAKVNSNTERWKSANYLNCYITQGNKNYQQLDQFMNEYGLGISMSLKLLRNGAPGAEGSNSVITQIYKNGTFTIEKWDEAVEIGKMVKRFASFPGHTDRGFVIALYKIREAGKVKIDTILEAYESYPEVMERKTTNKEYLQEIQKLVNHRKHKVINIL